MEFEEFKHYMDSVIKHGQVIDEAYNYLSYDLIDKLGVGCTGLVQLLKELMGDTETDWINYWLYELNCGEKYTADCVTIEDEIVPLKTLENLYKVLKDNYES